MDIIKLLEERYSTKVFDGETSLTQEELGKIEKILQLAPSSTNIQPWHFIIASSKEGKERIAKSTEGVFSFNTEKVLNASAVVVFATKTDLQEDYLNFVIEQEERDKRFPNEDVKNNVYTGRKMFADMHKSELQDLQHWFEKQVYLNLGVFLTGVASLGIDAVAMEGFDRSALDNEFGLTEEGYSSTILVPIGKRSEEDFNAKIPKSRLKTEKIITRV